MPWHPSGFVGCKFQNSSRHSSHILPLTLGLHWHNSPSGNDPHPTNVDRTPAGLQLHSVKTYITKINISS